MEKQLTKAEIQQLFDFVKSRGIQWYDVQLELVDHFASAIEGNWGTYPENWSFGQKILSIYNEMGRKGFRKIARSKIRMTRKNVNGLAFNYLKKAFKIPQIIGTIVLVFLLQQTFLSSEKPFEIFAAGILIPNVVLVCSTFYFCMKYYLSFKLKLITLEHSINLCLWSLFMLLPTHVVSMTGTFNFQFSPVVFFLIATMIILQIVFCIGILNVQRKMFLESKRRYAYLSNA